MSYGYNPDDYQLKISAQVEGAADVESLAKRLDEVGVAAKESSEAQATAAGRLSAAKAKQDELRLALQSAKNEYKFLADRAKESGAGQAIFAQQAAAAKVSMAELKGELGVARGNVSLLNKEYRAASSETRRLAAEQSRLKAEIRAASTEMNQAGASASTLKAGLASVATALGGIFAVSQLPGLARDLGQTADLYANLGARINLVNSAQAGFNVSLDDVSDIATRTHSPLETTTDLMAALARAGEGLSLRQADVLRLTETINKANQVSGASAASADAAVRQLIQGLQSGVLRGDEFNSVMEQAPRLAKALADGLNVPIGSLRAMAEAGELTADRVVKALQGQSAAIDEEFGKLPLTIGRALTDLSTKWTGFIGEMDQGAGASAKVAEAIVAVANNLDTLGNIAGKVGEVVLAALAVKAVNAVRLFMAEAVLATAATTRMAAATTTATTASGGHTTALIAEAAAIRAKYAAQATGATAAAAATSSLATAGTLASGAVASLGAGVLRMARAFTPLGVALLAVEGAIWALSDSEEDLAKKREASAKAAEDTAARETEAAATRSEAMKNTALEAEEARFKMSELQKTFLEITLSGKSAAEALTEIVKAFDIDTPAGIGKMVSSLGELKAGAQVTGEQIQTALIDKLKNLPEQELKDFGTMAEMAFDQGKISAKELGQVMDAQVRVALKNLGIDADVALTGMSQKFQQAASNVDIIVERFDHLRETGADAGAVLAQSLDAAINAAANTAEIDALRDKIAALGEQGLIAKDKLAEMMAALGQKSDQAKEGINSVSEALKTLGIRSDADLKKTADGFREAYEAVKKMGGSVREQQEAFKVYAKAAIEANGGVATSALKVEAAMNGLEITTDKAGKSIVEAMGAGKDRVDDLAASLDGVAASADNARSAVQSLGEGVQAMEGGGFAKDGYVTDAGGNPVRYQRTGSWSDWSDEDLNYLLSDKRDADPRYDQGLVLMREDPKAMAEAMEELERRNPGSLSLGGGGIGSGLIGSGKGSNTLRSQGNGAMKRSDPPASDAAVAREQGEAAAQAAEEKAAAIAAAAEKERLALEAAAQAAEEKAAATRIAAMEAAADLAIEAEALKDNSGRVDELRAAYEAAAVTLSTVQAAREAGTASLEDEQSASIMAAQAHAIYSGALADVTEGIQKKMAAQDVQADMAQAEKSLVLQQIEQALQLAEVKGDETEAMRLKNEASKVEMEMALLKSQAMADEAAAQLELVAARRAELAAAGQLTEANEAELKVTEARAEIQKLEAERARQAAEHIQTLREAQEAERIRQAEAAELARKAEEAERARQEREAELARQAEEAERQRQAEAEELARKQEEAERQRQAEAEELARKQEEAERQRQAEAEALAAKAEEDARARTQRLNDLAAEEEAAWQARQDAAAGRTQAASAPSSAIPSGMTDLDWQSALARSRMGAPARASTTHTIKIDIGRGQGGTVEVASPEDADTLTKLLNQLSNDAARR